MSKRTKNSPRVHEGDGARNTIAKLPSNLRAPPPHRLAAVCAGTCLLMASLAMAQPKVRPDPDPVVPIPPGGQSSLSVSDASVAESDRAAVLCFRVRVDPPSAIPIRFAYRVVDRTARFNLGDYQGISGTVTVPAHVSTTEIPITVFGDEILESDETLTLVIEGAENARVARGTATGTILNDDFVGSRGGGSDDRRRLPGIETAIRPEPDPDPGLPGPGIILSLADGSICEGHDGPAVLLFNFKLSAESTRPVSFTYRLADRSACSRETDYQAVRGTVMIPPGRSTGMVAVTVFGDRAMEPDEGFLLIAEYSGVIEHGIATGTIVDDDAGGGSADDERPRRRLPDGSLASEAGPDDALALAGQQQLQDGASFGLACANPVRGLPSFRFVLPRSSRVSLAMYDLAGRMVGNPVEARLPAGVHVQEWSQSKPMPGVYLVQFQTDGGSVTRQISWIE